ncbi:MAG: hypothetical protein KKB04_04955 [Candidatus Thermoplasmatota archaeon]|nr:hypothetical protein [Candidatus Thermoplasmatota archaeon]
MGECAWVVVIPIIAIVCGLLYLYWHKKKKSAAKESTKLGKEEEKSV